MACVVIPRFPLAVELLLRPALIGQPTVIGGAPEARKAVVACSPEAEREGVHRGMSLREAQAHCQDATFLEARPALYRDRFNHMLDALEEVSPVVEGAELGRAYVGIDGLGPLVGDEVTVAGVMVEAVRTALPLRPRVGIADSRFAAWAAALTSQPGETRILGPGEAAIFLAELSVERLPISDEMLGRLRWLGLRSIGDLAALPRGAVASQFGSEGARAWDLASGEGGEPLMARRRSVEVSDRLTFMQPATGEQAIVGAARHLLARLFARPECAGRAVRGLTLSLALENGHRWDRALTFREPVADRDRLLRALAAKVDGIALPAPAETLTLVLRDLCAEAGVQGSLFAAREKRQRRLETALGQLRSRFGQVLIKQIVEVEPWSPLPERRYALAAVQTQ